MYVSIGVFTYRSMHSTIDAVTGRETDRLDGRDVVPLVEAFEAVTCYTAVVNEEITTALVGGDEAVAFIVVEPLYRSLGHVWSPPFSVGAPQQQKTAPSFRAALPSK